MLKDIIHGGDYEDDKSNIKVNEIVKPVNTELLNRSTNNVGNNSHKWQWVS